MNLKPILLATASLIALTAVGAGLKIELPAETEVFKPGPRADLANAQCLVCHSADYISTQPKLPRTFWKASVVKMQEKYGAQIPADQVEPLVDYLSQTYGIPGTNSPSSTVSTLTGAVAGNQLVAQYGCIGCHQPNIKFVGPAWKQIAQKYATDPAGMNSIAQQITQGGSGKWGTIPMPPFKDIPASHIKAIGEWLLKQN